MSCFMVLVAGLEPARIFVRRILSPLRLPVPPHEQDALVVRLTMIAPRPGFVKLNFAPKKGRLFVFFIDH